MLVKANIKIIVFSLHMSYSPTKVIDKLILRELIMVFKLDGKITLVKI